MLEECLKKVKVFDFSNTKQILRSKNNDVDT